jgi:hypothetical protein
MNELLFVQVITHWNQVGIDNAPEVKEVKEALFIELKGPTDDVLEADHE